MDWIRSTFLYVRALAAPARYGLPPNLDKAQIEKKLEELCLNELNALEKYSLIVKNAKDQGDDSGMMVSATLYGRLMAQYCLNFRTVKLLRKIKGTEPLLEIFTLLTYCDEFAVFKCRNSDKRTLNELNRSSTRSTIRFPLRGRIQSTTAMASCLMQAVFGNLPIEDGSLQQEATKMINIGRRLIKCMTEFIYVGQGTIGQDGGGVYQALLSTVVLSQCLETKLWENSPYITKQLKGIGAIYAGQLAARGKISFQELLDTNPRELEVILKKNPPFGSDLIAFVRTLPVFSIDLVLKKDYFLEVTVNQKNDCYNKKLAVKISILVGDSNNNVLFFKENLDANPGGSCWYQESFKLSDATVATATGHVICSNWTGLDCSKSIVINKEAANASSQKQRSRKANNTNASKKITEFYRKDDPTLKNTTRQVASISVGDRRIEQLDEEVEILPIEDTQNLSFLDTFRFTQKPKLSIDKQNEDSLQFVTASTLKNIPQNSNNSDVTMINLSERIDRPTLLEDLTCGTLESLNKSHSRHQLRAHSSNDSGYESYVPSNSVNSTNTISDSAFPDYNHLTSNNAKASHGNSFGFFGASIVEIRHKPQIPAIPGFNLNTINPSDGIAPEKSLSTFQAVATLDKSPLETASKRLKLNNSNSSQLLQAPSVLTQSSDETESDTSPTNPKKLNFFSQPARCSVLNPPGSTLPKLAPCIPIGPPRYNPSNRMQYFMEMHRRDPFILFGRPADIPAQQERQKSSLRRVCLFGVFSEMPRYRGETSGSGGVAATSGNVANERQVFRSMYSVDGDNNGGRFYRKNYHHARQGRRELDLGINEFLSSTSDQQDAQKENFFK
ncbi:uncharacterized protein LOC110674773 [Aedes aegypti]|uniref:SEC63 domain-containing protein n=1 Tax=Aedes aegypti TaxID=7159 RepID=A0A6I8TXQ5_AEDAE|nr:uncharacterized protein LOC110674773 [Aedes aegypti]XP_021694764.1 uncharacterized protein LOC110674773 [Aedes aegypti]